MRNHVLLFGLLFIIQVTKSQTPVADFDFVAEYQCGWAFLGLENKSINADSVFWDFYGKGNFEYRNTSYPPIGNLSIDGDFKISLIAKRNGLYDTITKVFELRQTRVEFDNKAAYDTAGFAPLTIDFINNSQESNGDSLTYKWDFGDGDTSLLMNPSHVYTNPKTYFPTLTAETQSGCILRYSENIIVKDTAQRNEFDFITGGCNEYEAPPCGWDKHLVIENDTLKIYGFYGGNCCTHKTATVRNSLDTVIIRTFDTGPLCTCSCGFCFAINIPDIIRDSVYVSFDGEIFTAKKIQTGIKDNSSNNTVVIFPNPTKRDFTIDFSSLPSKIIQVEIFNTFGQSVFKDTYVNATSLNINTENFKSGIYLIRTFDYDSNIYLNKILVNK